MQSNTVKKLLIAGLPHTQGTQGIQGNSGDFQVEENLRETQGDSGKLREVLKFKKISVNFLLDLQWDLINLVQYFIQENKFLLILSAYLEIFKLWGYFLRIIKKLREV